MDKQQYRKYIKEMLDSIEDLRMLMTIYWFVHAKFIKSGMEKNDGKH